MKFPCPECAKILEPDRDWGYCPYCGSLLEHASLVGEWRNVATFRTLGDAAFAADELKHRGFPTRVRAESVTAPSNDVHVGALDISYPVHVVDVSADSYEDAVAAMAEIRDAADEEDEPAAPRGPASGRGEVLPIGGRNETFHTFALVILALLAGAAVGAAAMATYIGDARADAWRTPSTPTSVFV